MRKIKQKGKKAKKKQKSSKTEKKIHNKSTEIRQIGCQSTIPSGWKARPIVPFLPNPLLILFSLFIYILFLAFHLPPALLLSLLHLLALLLRSSFVISERGKCTKNVQRERERETEREREREKKKFREIWNEEKALRVEITFTKEKTVVLQTLCWYSRALLQLCRLLLYSSKLKLKKNEELFLDSWTNHIFFLIIFFLFCHQLPQLYTKVVGCPVREKTFPSRNGGVCSSSKIQKEINHEYKNEISWKHSFDAIW